MFVAIGLLCGPGILYNNLNNNGLVVSQSATLTCDQTGLLICQTSGSVGCQANSAFCNLSGSSISFLNGNSPFTALLNGQIFNLFNSYTGAGQQHGPFDLLGGGPYTRANCLFTPGVVGNRHLTDWNLIGTCTQMNPDGSNVTSSQATVFTNYNTLAFGSTKTMKLISQANTSSGGDIDHVYQWLAQVNYTSPGGTTGYTFYGLDFFSPVGGGCCTNAQLATKAMWGFIVAVPFEAGVIPAGNTHQTVYVQNEPFSGFECIAANQNAANSGVSLYTSQGCTQFLQNLKIGSSASCTPSGNTITCASSGGGSSFVFGFLTPIMLFLAGIILFLIGLGIQFNWGGTLLGTGTQFGTGTNPQGTKLAQVMGLGLVVWTFLFSQFSTWFTSGLLPLGLDGTFGIVSIFITGAFFFALFGVSQGSGTTTTQGST